MLDKFYCLRYGFGNQIRFHLEGPTPQSWLRSALQLMPEADPVSVRRISNVPEKLDSSSRHRMSPRLEYQRCARLQPCMSQAMFEVGTLACTLTVADSCIIDCSSDDILNTERRCIRRVSVTYSWKFGHKVRFSKPPGRRNSVCIPNDS
jgi:hypothetical protein